MIAACPQCRSRYRIPRERIAPQGSRLRCAKCSCVFCVQAPPRETAPSPLPSDDAGPPTASGLEPATMPALHVVPVPAPAPAAAKVTASVAVPFAAPVSAPVAAPAPPPSAALPRGRALVIEPDAAMARRIERLLTRFALDTECVTHGGEGLLRVFRDRPDLLVLGGHLEGLASRSFAEIVRRASDLRGLRMIRLAAIDEPRGVPEFEADHTLEPGSVPQGLGALLVQMGFEPVAQAAPPPEAPVPPPRVAATAPRPAPAPAPVAASPRPAPAPAPAPIVSEPAIRPPAPPGPAPDALLGQEIAAAERLARIIVSDIILYNEEKFARAVQQGDLVEALRPELDEGLSLFRQRVAERVRAQRDFVIEELERRAAARRER